MKIKIGLATRLLLLGAAFGLIGGTLFEHSRYVNIFAAATACMADQPCADTWTPFLHRLLAVFTGLGAFFGAAIGLIIEQLNKRRAEAAERRNGMSKLS